MMQKKNIQDTKLTLNNAIKLIESEDIIYLAICGLTQSRQFKNIDVLAIRTPYAFLGVDSSQK
jgi:hypothetical protein